MIDETCLEIAAQQVLKALDTEPTLFAAWVEELRTARETLRYALAKKLKKESALKEHELNDVRCACCGYMTYHREHIGCIRAGLIDEERQVVGTWDKQQENGE